jgi:hypothetical protein
MRKSGARVPRSVLVTVLGAAVVTAGALIAVAGSRPRPDTPAGVGAAADRSAAEAASWAACGAGRCVELASVAVKGTLVALLADPNGGSGRLRIGPEAANVRLETMITSMGARLGADSLRCADGSIQACLVRGESSDGTVGEVFSNHRQSWRRMAEKPYLSDAGNLSLSDVEGNGSPDVIVVRHECPATQPGSAKCAAPVLGSVFDLAGRPLGCTKMYTSPSQMRGWPDIRLTNSDLRACP